MTEKEQKEIILDILNNGAEYEYTYKDDNGDYVPEIKFTINDIFNAMHRGEYHKVSKWYVYFNPIYVDNEDCGMFVTNETYGNPLKKLYEGTEQDCKLWVINKNKWINKYIHNLIRSGVTINEDNIQKIVMASFNKLKNYLLDIKHPHGNGRTKITIDELCIVANDLGMY